VPARSLVTAVASLMAAVAVTAACSNAGPAAATRPEAQERVQGVTGKRIEVVAVGDIACPPKAATTATTCRQAETAALAKKLDPDAVLALGDLQYEVGALRAFRHSYDESWGAVKSITYPVPGNHEYNTDGAPGYYTYFKKRQPGAPGYYATNLGKWRVYGLNTNCTDIDCDKQRSWLVDDIKDHPRTCSLFTMHFPRYSSGEHGSQSSVRPLFRIAYRKHVDLVLAGHDHHYERFRPMNHRGKVVDNGVTSFVSGGGGKSHYRATGDITGSAFVEDDTFGVLRLVLKPDSFSYGFRGIDGSSKDNGSRSCV
jgi:3',5'-cyclic AMP phosphodiesterase CpdA